MLSFRSWLDGVIKPDLEQTEPRSDCSKLTETLIYWISYSCEYLIYLRRTNFGKSKRKYERFCMWKVSFFIGLGEKAIIDSGFTIIYSCKKKLNIYQKTEPRSVPIFEPDFWNRFRLRKNQIKNRSAACPIGHTLICKESKTSNVLLPLKCVIEDYLKWILWKQ